MWAALALGAFGVAVVCHLLTVRLPLPFSVVIRYLLAGGIIGVGLLTVLLTLYGVSGEAFAGVMIFAFLSELYMFSFTLVIGSVSVSLMLYLRDAPMDEAEIARIFSSQRMVAFRLEQMTRNGFTTEHNGQYALTASGRQMVYWFVTLRKVFGHELARQR